MEKVQGLGFSPYMDGQNPNWGTHIPDSQIQSLISVIAPFTNWIRTYGCDHGLENIGRIAKSAGLKVAAGAWLGTDSNANEVQINNLISAVNSGNVDIAIVGNEALLFHLQTLDSLIGYIERVKRATNNRVPVTTGEPYGVYFDNPRLFEAVDVVCAHIYPFWEKQSFNNSIQFVKNMYAELVKKASGKTIWIGETSWPSGGNNNGSAHPSPENAVEYFTGIVSWARTEKINYFYFEFMDENWKEDGGIEVGHHWGLFNANAKALKPGMEKAFSQLAVV